MLFHSKNNKRLLTVLSLIFVLGGIALIATDIQKRTDESVIRYTAQSVWDYILSRESSYALEESRPVSLRIPKLSVEAPFIPLGVTDENEIAVPSSTTDVGWYEYGPTPGEIGPAIVLGHVDSKSGPGVFFYLGQLEPGDRIEVEREDGTVAEFVVDALDRYEQSNFPTSLVYGDINHAGLRLITCSGSYDREQKRYDRNLVVYASLVEPIARSNQSATE